MATAAVASAESTDWITGYEALEMKPKLKGKLLQSIECRDVVSNGLNLRKSEFRLTYTNNPSKKRFLWAVGSEYGRYNARAQKEGYELVSLHQYSRQSGLKVRCAVWHKKQ